MYYFVVRYKLQQEIFFETEARFSKICLALALFDGFDVMCQTCPQVERFPPRPQQRCLRILCCCSALSAQWRKCVHSREICVSILLTARIACHWVRAVAVRVCR